MSDQLFHTESSRRIFLSVLLPTLNEAESIRLLLPRLVETLHASGYRYEILVVDGNSKDGTPDVIEKFTKDLLPEQAKGMEGCQVIKQELPGYGEALKAGFAQFKGDFLATMDADLSHHPGVITDMIAVAQATQADMVIGSRFIRGGGTEAPFYRAFLSKILNKFFRFSLNLPYQDLSSGFRLYKRSALKSLKFESGGYEILEEILVKFHIQGYRIVEAPFRYRPRKHGQSHARIFAFGIRYLKLLPSLRRLRIQEAVADHEEKTYFSRNPIQRWWCRQRFKSILKNSVDFGRTLDLGCGSDLLVDVLPNSVGVDLNLAKLRYKRAPGRRLIQADGCFLPFSKESFDQVICCRVLEHIEAWNQEDFLREVSRVLKPGGRLILYLPLFGSPFWKLIRGIYSFWIPSRYPELYSGEIAVEQWVEKFKKLDVWLKKKVPPCPGEVLMVFERGGRIQI
jgi:dolichol-phosphate mannosyltransferase